MNATLVIMAAGLGSRFGEGLKQLEPVGPNGETIIDYSVFDAKKAGFNKVVFIIRKSIEEDFKKIIGNKVSQIIDVEYVFQETDKIPNEYKHIKREKPWGTGHAIMCAKEYINEPFLIINADDYYGYEAYKKAYDFLNSATGSNYCMISYLLKNTISDNGTVNRGVCKIQNNLLTQINEIKNIERVNGKYIGYDGDEQIVLNEDAYVSMNMFAFLPDMFIELENEWNKFLKNYEQDNSEFYLPKVVNYMVENNKAKVYVLNTTEAWLGMTYKSDSNIVKDKILKLIMEGKYPQELYKKGE